MAPKRPAAASFPNSIYLTRGSPGTQTEQVKVSHASQARVRDAASGELRGPRERRDPGGTCPDPSLPFSDPRSTSPQAHPARASRRISRRAQDPSAPPAAGAEWCSWASAFTCPEIAGIGLSAARRPSLAPAIPAAIVRTCVWSLAGLGRGRAGMGAGASSELSSARSGGGCSGL